jgi:transposase InsO family protein
LKNRKEKYFKTKQYIKNKIIKTYHDNNGVYGYRFISYYLNRHYKICSQNTVYKYMKELNIRSIVRRKKPVYVKTNSHKIHENLINKNFTVSKPNTSWCIDFTYLPMKNTKFRYNCTIIDLYNRSVVASVNSNKIDTNLAIKTVHEGLKNIIVTKLIIHSDQGSQFTSKQFNIFCTRNNLIQSMSRKGKPCDNSPMERYYNTLKNEYYNLYEFSCIEKVDEGIKQFNLKYNYERPHTFNGGIPPRLVK